MVGNLQGNKSIKRTPRGTSSHSQYYLPISPPYIVHKMVIVLSYSCLLSHGSVLDTPEAAKDVPAPVCSSVHALYM